MTHHDVIIIGGGQAGLATARAATGLGLAPLVLEASDSATGSWSHYYDSLTLFSPARCSALPGKPFPGDPDGYPARDEVVDYLAAYAEHLDAEIRTGQKVVAVTGAGPGGFEVEVEGAGTLSAARVVAASGGFGRPHRPHLPGLEDFGGTVLHSSQYCGPEQISGRRVVIVGGGNSAVQIGIELAEKASVTLATRHPLRFMPQRPFGRDIHLWLKTFGLDTAGWARPLLTGGKGTPVMDTGAYRQAIAQGRPDRRPMFRRLDATGVVWADGTREDVDVVLLATGYRPELGYLSKAGALDSTGMPLHRQGLSTTHAGLGYVGLEWQRSFASATLRGVGADARHVMTALRARPGA
ncbi:NAD(P)/FAD-dependent oxidoreductase [Actinocorallia libanotica]